MKKKKTKKIPVKSVGNIIKEEREKQKLRPIDLAWKINKTDVTEKLVKDWESGNKFPDLDMMYKLAELLDINPNELLNLRNTIQEESYVEPDFAARRVCSKFFAMAKPVLSVIFRLTVGICIIYIVANYKNFENKVGGAQDQEQIDFVANVIQNGINQYVVSPSNSIDNNQLQNETEDEILNNVENNVENVSDVNAIQN